MEAYSDRSRLLKYQHCPRARYFEYEIPTKGMTAWDGESVSQVNGVVSTKLDLDLLVGSCFHRGIEGVLRSHGIERAVVDCLEEFWTAVKSRGGILGESEDAYYVYNEHAALVEALVRGWEKFSLPQLLDRYTIVEVEEEYLGIFEVPGFKLNFGGRIDALLMDKSTLELVVLSLKTTKEWGKKSDDEARHDMQGLSECELVDQKLKKWQDALDEADRNGSKVTYGIPKWFLDRRAASAPPQVSSVKMEFALKGRKSEYPEDSGRYSYSNPLIRPWKKDDGLNSVQWAWKYEVQDEYGHKHRLGKGWNRVNIWEDIGIKAWIDILATQSIQGFAPLAALVNQFVLPMEYFRNDDDIVRMKRMVAGQEKRIEEGSRLMRSAVYASPEKMEEALDDHFPMHTKSCDWPKKCPYQEICFGPRAYVHDPISSQIYQIRTPNHPIELTLAQK